MTFDIDAAECLIARICGPDMTLKEGEICSMLALACAEVERLRLDFNTQVTSQHHDITALDIETEQLKREASAMVEHFSTVVTKVGAVEKILTEREVRIATLERAILDAEHQRRTEQEDLMFEISTLRGKLVEVEHERDRAQAINESMPSRPEGFVVSQARGASLG